MRKVQFDQFVVSTSNSVNQRGSCNFVVVIVIVVVVVVVVVIITLVVEILLGFVIWIMDVDV